MSGNSVVSGARESLIFLTFCVCASPAIRSVGSLVRCLHADVLRLGEDFGASGYTAVSVMPRYTASSYVAHGYAASSYAAIGYSANGNAAKSYSANGYTAKGYTAKGFPFVITITPLVVTPLDGDAATGYASKRLRTPTPFCFFFPRNIR